ncbi:hypothetical protein Ct9H90mP29_12510 [bacterium]|nr:MAG: hypothetical protein Ct9H90mP29_12510 [bacterium]
MLISTVFSFGNMVKRNEWTAMKASGIVFIESPFLNNMWHNSFGMFICLDNKLVAYGNEKRFEIDRDHVKRKSSIN